MHGGENIRFVVRRINVDLVAVGDHVVPTAAKRAHQAEQQDYVSQSLLRFCRAWVFIISCLVIGCFIIGCFPWRTVLRISAAPAQSATGPRTAPADALPFLPSKA